MYYYYSLKNLWDTNGKNVGKSELFSLFENIKLSDNFQKEINIEPQIKTYNFKNNNITKVSHPINFEIIRKEFFEPILNQINPNLLMRFETQKIMFLNQKLIIKTIKDSFFICSTNDSSQFIIKYILITKDNNLIKAMIKDIYEQYNGNCEIYFSTKLGLNLNKCNYLQKIINKANKLILGYFISVSYNNLNNSNDNNYDNQKFKLIFTYEGEEATVEIEGENIFMK